MEDVKRVKFEYLFLDIEWNQAPGTSDLDGREAIQIGVVAADANLQKVKIFSKGIKLRDPNLFNEKTNSISHIPLENIMQGKEEQVVLMNFAFTFPEYRFLVVWTRDTYNLFLRDMRKNGILIKRHKAIILQDVLGVIVRDENNQIGFENALTCAGIKYVSNHLHYAKHDASYLYQLFCQCFQQYSRVTVGEKCFANEITRKLHTGNCGYMHNMSIERKILVSKNMIFKGYTVCKHCGKEQNWKQLDWKFSSKHKEHNKKYGDYLKLLSLTEISIEEICKWFQLSCSISNGIVFVKTAFSRWIVYLQEDKVKELFHENYRISNSQYLKKQKMKYAEGYHKQKLPSENFYEVIRYIKDHDAGMVKRMLKKSRLEKLLEMVEMELKT